MRTKTFASVFLFILLLSSSGCIRYTPSRSELYSSQSGEKSEHAKISAQDFLAYEARQERKLEEMVQRRQELGASRDDWYRFGPNDMLKVFVFDVPELNITTRVKQSGAVTLPLLGDVPVAGKTELEAQEDITNRLTKFVKNPQVIVSVGSYIAHKVSILGEVAKPGTISLRRGDYSIIDVLSEVGGRTERAGSSIVLIPSDTSGNTTPDTALKKAKTMLASSASAGRKAGIEIPFDRLVGSADALPLEIPVFPGDTIIVPAAGMVQVDGEVAAPGSIKLASRMTLLGAIASAGGLSYSADVNAIELIREIDPGKKKVLTVDLEKLVADLDNDIRLRDGDIIRIPSHSGRFVTRQVMDAINSVLSFGVGGSVNVAK